MMKKLVAFSCVAALHFVGCGKESENVAPDSDSSTSTAEPSDEEFVFEVKMPRTEVIILFLVLKSRVLYFYKLLDLDCLMLCFFRFRPFAHLIDALKLKGLLDPYMRLVLESIMKILMCFITSSSITWTNPGKRPLRTAWNICLLFK